ncbi:MAG: phenylalanine--tRNA ligase subunit beta [Nevskia sp.]|nr:phenylalanine--tRNA ligase subunit beta [Nevskia sp.]
MKLSERWLREWVNPPADSAELAARLTAAGLECTTRPLTDDPPRGVVVARIRGVAPHPQAERLRICEVDAGHGSALKIVCGAPNARAGLVTAAALPGAVLPGGRAIERASLRGVESEGMLCSAAELGLGEDAGGLIELDADAAPGTPLERVLALDDRLLELELTPNRGDCLSVAGLAREVAALYVVPALGPREKPAVVSAYHSVDVTVEDSTGCPHYLGRVVTRLDPKARTPAWMRERLRRSGLRAIHPLVDVTNYVMLELGQPMHAFDCAQLKGGVRVRRARPGEKLRLLNGQTVELDAADLLIADGNGPLALAGVMGGEPSGVGAQTSAVFLESACFDPATVAAAGRRHKLNSDARYRFERGVDPALQRRALDRATVLIQQICGGEPGPIVEVGRAPAHGATIHLRHGRVERLLGCPIPARDIPPLLARLNIETQAEAAGAWRARVPTYRCDLRIEADLIEEIARLHGYERIPARSYAAQLTPHAPSERRRSLDALKDVLVARGWQEALCYSFVDPRLQDLLLPDLPAIALDNPIAETMSVLRTTLWSGLIPAWRYNRSRQQPRARLFECAACYFKDDGGSRETLRIAGLAAGSAVPEQWASPPRAVDFYDVKGDLEALFGRDAGEYRFEPQPHPALHPGQSARIFRGERPVGWLGSLHPRLSQTLELAESLVLFELDAVALCETRLPAAQPIPEFPSARRDLALVVREEIGAERLIATVREAGGLLLQSVRLFDIYRGAGLPEGHKSMALGLIFQDRSRTLNEAEIDAAVANIIAGVSAHLGASVRG